MNIYQYIFR